MASGGQPDGGKRPAKGLSNRGGGKSPPDRKVRKPGARRVAGKAPAGRGGLWLLAAWILALAILGATLYFSGSGRRQPQSHGPERTPARSAESPRHPPGNAPGNTGVDHAHEKPAGSNSHDKNAKTPVGSAASFKPTFSASVPTTAEPSTSKDLLALNRPSPAVPHPKPPTAPILARVAIIIDDFGPDIAIAREFASLPFVVTFSVLPFQAHSAEIAGLAHSRGREVILHLPMEPHGYPKTDPGRGALLLSMSEDAIKTGDWFGPGHLASFSGGQ